MAGRSPRRSVWVRRPSPSVSALRLQVWGWQRTSRITSLAPRPALPFRGPASSVSHGERGRFTPRQPAAPGQLCLRPRSRWLSHGRGGDGHVWEPVPHSPPSRRPGCSLRPRPTARWLSTGERVYRVRFQMACFVFWLTYFLRLTKQSQCASQVTGGIFVNTWPAL